MTVLHETDAGDRLPGTSSSTLHPGFADRCARLAARLRGGPRRRVPVRPEHRSRASSCARSRDAIRAANPRAVIAIDEEGGDVTRLYYDRRRRRIPGNALLGRIDDLELTARGRRARSARSCARAGVNLNFAPDVDINSNPDNPVIGVRSFGADPELVGAAHRRLGRGSRGRRASPSSAKHFPGHGDTAQDSHLALPVVDLPLETLRERELVPFRGRDRGGRAHAS